MKIPKVIFRIKNNIKAHNKYMTDEYLEGLSVISKLRLCHPLDRKDLAHDAMKLELITQSEYNKVIIWK